MHTLVVGGDTALCKLSNAEAGMLVILGPSAPPSVWDQQLGRLLSMAAPAVSGVASNPDVASRTAWCSATALQSLPMWGL
jgi:hypothetical protein